MKNDIRDRLKDVFISRKNSGYLFDIIIKKILTNYPLYREILMECIEIYRMNILDLQEYIFNDNVDSIYQNNNDLEDILIALNKITVSKFEYLLLQDLDKKYYEQKNKNVIETKYTQKELEQNISSKTENIKQLNTEKYAQDSNNEYLYNERCIHFMAKDCYKENNKYMYNLPIKNLKSIDLQSIYLKCDMYNINEYNNKFYIIEQNIKTLVTIPIGYYSIQNLLECIAKFINLVSINKNKDYIYKIFLNVLKNRVCFTINNINNTNNNNNNLSTFSVLFIENENNYNLADILGFDKKKYTNNSFYIANESPNTNIFEKIYVQIFLNDIQLMKYEMTNDNFCYYDTLHIDMEKDFGKCITFSSKNNQYDINVDFKLETIGFAFNNSSDYHLDNLKFEIIMRFEYE